MRCRSAGPTQTPHATPSLAQSPLHPVLSFSFTVPILFRALAWIPPTPQLFLSIVPIAIVLFDLSVVSIGFHPLPTSSTSTTDSDVHDPSLPTVLAALSGLSITEWQPITGILPPITKAEWDVEWEKYRVSPEGIMTNSKIDREEFKKIFYMEWAHRIAGRTLGVAFILPTVYYLTRYRGRLPPRLPAKLLLIGLGIGFQGFLGWYMVQSGLSQEIIDNNSVPRVSQYRLAAHLSAALALYMGMTYTAFGLLKDIRPSASTISLTTSSIMKYRRYVGLAGFMVFFTAVSGAFVAGLDAGLVYNEWPTMGGRLVPPTDELLDERYAKRSDKQDNWWRNMLENPVTAQFDHRLFATTTFFVVLSLHLLARRQPLKSKLPRSTVRLSAYTALAAFGQVGLGISTLLYMVPVHLAATHQAGSVVLLTCIMGMLASLRSSSQVMTMLKRR
ncbi:heme a synthase, partial [Tremellales sp. Uapishka_1]